MPTPEQIPTARLRAAEAAAVLGAADRFRRQYLIADLQRGIERMADRYADTAADRVAHLLAGDDTGVERLRRRGQWQHKALCRLAQALANLAVGAA